MNKSTHKVEIISVKLEPHPNADSLSIAKIWGYNVIVRTDEWKDGDLGAYIVPDSLCPDTPQFEFLGKNKRVTVRRFRGLFSQGLLIRAPEGSKVGDNVADILGITRYEPPETFSTKTPPAHPPSGFHPKYDVEDWHKCNELLIPGEIVIATEKIHGANARFVFADNKMNCGSRNQWKQDDGNDLWWNCLKKNPWLEEFCRTNPQYTVYGEIYGTVQKLHYGLNSVEIALFDIWNSIEAKFLSWKEISQNIWLMDGKGNFGGKELAKHWVPIIAVIEYNSDRIKTLSNGPSLITGATHVREGIVLTPYNERIDPNIGRVKLKIVSDEYLAKEK